MTWRSAKRSRQGLPREGKKITNKTKHFNRWNADLYTGSGANLFFLFLSLLQYWSFLWLLHSEKKSFIKGWSRALWSKKLCCSDWMDRHTILLCSPLGEYYRIFSKYFPPICHRLVLYHNTLLKCYQSVIGLCQVRKTPSVFLNNLTNLCGSSGNLFFF